jgi:hypothetical protein
MAPDVEPIGVSWLAALPSVIGGPGSDFTVASCLPLLVAEHTLSAAARARGPAQVAAWRVLPSGSGRAARTGNDRSRDVGKLFDQSGGFFVGQVKVLHDTDMGVNIAFGCTPASWNTLQHFSPGRHPAIEDFAASALGALCGGLAIALLWRRLSV